MTNPNNPDDSTRTRTGRPPAVRISALSAVLLALALVFSLALAPLAAGEEMDEVIDIGHYEGLDDDREYIIVEADSVAHSEPEVEIYNELVGTRYTVELSRTDTIFVDDKEVFTISIEDDIDGPDDSGLYWDPYQLRYSGDELSVVNADFAQVSPDQEMTTPFTAVEANLTFEHTSDIPETIEVSIYNAETDELVYNETVDDPAGDNTTTDSFEVDDLTEYDVVIQQGWEYISDTEMTFIDDDGEVTGDDQEIVLVTPVVEDTGIDPTNAMLAVATLIGLWMLTNRCR